jgi:hypothetical protein
MTRLCLPWGTTVLNVEGRSCDSTPMTLVVILQPRQPGEPFDSPWPRAHFVLRFGGVHAPLIRRTLAHSLVFR